MFAEKRNFCLGGGHETNMTLPNAVFSIVQPKLGEINRTLKILMAFPFGSGYPQYAVLAAIPNAENKGDLLIWGWFNKCESLLSTSATKFLTLFSAPVVGKYLMLTSKVFQVLGVQFILEVIYCISFEFLREESLGRFLIQPRRLLRHL
jgi:hypothetical protein